MTLAKSRKKLILEARGALSNVSEALAQAEAQHSLLVSAAKELLSTLETVGADEDKVVREAMDAVEAELRLETEDVGEKESPPALDPDDVKAILGWLGGAEAPYTNGEGRTSLSLILPETLLEGLKRHLEALS